MIESDNLDSATVDGFGDEWAAFDQTALTGEEYRCLFDDYFHIFPFASLPPKAEGFDLGCGSGRWAAGVAPKVGRLHCIDPAERALAVARGRLHDAGNVDFHLAAADAIPLDDSSQDFGYSLGVLHHVPDTAKALNDAVRKLRPGAPFLLYLYYRFENRPAWFRRLWKLSDIARRRIATLPFGPRRAVTEVVAAGAYWPLARGARLAEILGANVSHWPLSAYRKLSYYTMRTDALDRLGTKLEQRFDRSEIDSMMRAAGLTDIRFSDRVPYWVACGVKGGG